MFEVAYITFNWVQLMLSLIHIFIDSITIKIKSWITYLLMIINALTKMALYCLVIKEIKLLVATYYDFFLFKRYNHLVWFGS